jgi:hypothetical protein
MTIHWILGELAKEVLRGLAIVAGKVGDDSEQGQYGRLKFVSAVQSLATHPHTLYQPQALAPQNCPCSDFFLEIGMLMFVSTTMVLDHID